jgi:hypothetical protein
LFSRYRFGTPVDAGEAFAGRYPVISAPVLLLLWRVNMLVLGVSFCEHRFDEKNAETAP